MRVAYAALAIIGILLIAYSLTSQNTGFDESKWYSWQQGVEISQKEGKKMFVFLASPTCPKCAEFKEFFASSDVMSFISSNFVPVYVDVTKERPISVSFVPTFCVGFPGNISCFSASSGSELMSILRQMSQ